MTQADIYAGLTSIMRDVLMIDDLQLSPQMCSEDVEGWDSFKMIEIVIGVESYFAITVHSRDLDHMHTVGDIVACVERAYSVQPLMQ